MSNEKLIIIHLHGGLVTDVQGLPEKYEYQILDWDEDNTYSAEEAIPYLFWILHNIDNNTDALCEITRVLDRIEP
jgi:hypothetical protein